MAHNQDTVFSGVFEKYEKARRLFEEDGTRSTESEPYKSKYAAKEIFVEIKSELKKARDNLREDADSRLSILEGAVDYYLGVIHVETDELSTGEEHLNRCLEHLQEYEMDPQCIIVVLSALNQLGLLWCKRGSCDKSQGYLERAESAYKRYVAEVNKPPYNIPDIFCNEVDDVNLEKNFQKLENILTHTLYYLAQVYSNMDEDEKAALYCHSTLSRQLESKEFDSVDWALNSATLSQCFVRKDEFGVGRHHLACATYILEQHESELQSTEGSKSEMECKWETLQRGKADVARCWAKYGEVLLSKSREKLLAKAEEDCMLEEMERVTIEEIENDENLRELTSVPESGQTRNELSAFITQNPQNMLFKSLEVTSIEEQVTTQVALDFEQAKHIFLNAQKWLNKTKEHYSLDCHASEHIQIAQDMSNLYKLLVFFEPNPDRQCKMHKRRIDTLEAVVKELNPQYYLNACRQMQFELGEIYSEIMDIKSGMIRDGETESTSHTQQKINHLTEQSIKRFRTFLDTFRDSNKKMPSKFPEELVRPALLAYFFMGRLHSKLITSEPEMELAYLKLSLDNYQKVVDYCDEYKEADSFVKEEIEVCREMARLLPAKMDKLLHLAS